MHNSTSTYSSGNGPESPFRFAGETISGRFLNLRSVVRHGSVYVLLMLFWTISLPLSAQSVDWIRTTGPINYRDNGMSVDAAGNIFATGGFSGNVDFDPGPGSFTLSAGAAGSAIFVTKLDAAGNLIWAKAISGNNLVQTGSIRVSNDGHLIITGGFRGTLVLGAGPASTTLNATGNLSSFIAKLDGDGNLIWASLMAGNGTATAATTVQDASGNVFVTGTFSGTAGVSPGPASATMTASATDTFIAKLNASGTVQWVYRLGTGFGNELETDPAGNIYIGGSFSGSIDFDPGPDSFTLTGSGGYTAKLNNDGNPVWAAKTGGGGTIASIAVDGSGNVYSTGIFSGTAVTGDGPASTTLHAEGLQDLVVMKRNSSGELQWIKLIGSSEFAQDKGLAVLIDNGGDLYLAGEYSGTTVVGPGPGATTLVAGNIDTNGFVAKLTNTGNVLWVKAITSTGISSVNGLGKDQAGNIYLKGSGGNTTGYLNPGAIPVPENFIMKLATIEANPVVSGSVVCTGGTFPLSVQATGGTVPYSYTWTAPAGITLPANTNIAAITGTAATSITGVYTLTVTVAGSGSAAAAGNTVSISVVNGPGAVPPSAIATLSADESGCPVRIAGEGTGSSFVITGPGEAGGYVFSNVYRSGGTHPILATEIKQPGVYRLTATYTNECGSSIPMTQSVTVSRRCP